VLSPWQWPAWSVGLVVERLGWLPFPARPWPRELWVGSRADCAVRADTPMLNPVHLRVTRRGRRDELEAGPGLTLVEDAGVDVVTLRHGKRFKAGRTFLFRDLAGPARAPELEAALLARPDDEVLLRAYADFLVEQGDPRGAWMNGQWMTELRGGDGAQGYVSLWAHAGLRGVLAHRRLGLVDRVEWMGPDLASAQSLGALLDDWEGSFLRALTLRGPPPRGAEPLPYADRLVRALALPPTLRTLELGEPLLDETWALLKARCVRLER